MALTRISIPQGCGVGPYPARILGQSPISWPRISKCVPGRVFGPSGISRSLLPPPNCSHGHICSIGARRLAFLHSKPHPGARFQVRGREIGLQIRVSAPCWLIWPRRTPAAARALSHSRAPPSAPPPVDCCGPVPPSLAITAASRRARSGEMGSIPEYWALPLPENFCRFSEVPTANMRLAGEAAER